MINVLPLALAIYWLLEYVVRRASYPGKMEPAGFRPEWIPGGEWAIIVSPGFWLSRCLANRTRPLPKPQSTSARRILITKSNLLNLVVSALIASISLLAMLSTRGALAWSLIADLAALRYISRTTEIAYAFGRDVLTPTENKSGLDKHARLGLALRSYCELFLLAIPVYLLCFPKYATPLKALTLSLCVGTLTNVGYGLPEDHGFRSLLIFPQVIATLSLVLLSLASYISRPEPESAPEAEAGPK
ncbi:MULTISPECIES: hypothetical protein [Paraburkholderia]|uniref:Uncharacterized protein n=1 Tax=Paraburkholderia madseniana TaxID=2599607 RepID=A0AAP5ENS7_9BURK|nr:MULTISPECIES: hypothetical protein [Paraburkholderia]MCX4146900.1 hypothetical protein [Paraburkholderia madseniana]MDN7149846.1 hypothetical protein [Paraburkholderia sp. WS6]MDQ6408726.1 hypothetical protein [Paraburkholderia madseniana]